MVLFFENLDCHVVDCGVIKNHETSVGTRLYMHADIFAKLIVYAAEIIAHCLYCKVRTNAGYTMCRAVGQTVFESAKAR